MKVLITGVSGTGKSAICGELQKQGYKAIDADTVQNLTFYENRKDGNRAVRPIPLPQDWNEAHSWKWDRDILSHLLNDVIPGPIFLCGNADNQNDFYKSFDKLFVLTADPDTLRARLLNRRSNPHNYGRDPDELATVLRYYDMITNDALNHGALPIDTTQPLAQVVSQIVGQLDANQ